MTLALTLAPLIRSWNFVLYNLVFNACVVALLTWVVMPLITRALRGWLRRNDPKALGRDHHLQFNNPLKKETHNECKSGSRHHSL